MIVCDEFFAIKQQPQTPFQKKWYVGLLVYEESNKDIEDITELPCIFIIQRLNGYMKNKWKTPEKIYNWILHNKQARPFVTSTMFKKGVYLKIINKEIKLKDNDLKQIRSSYPLSFMKINKK